MKKWMKQNKKLVWLLIPLVVLVAVMGGLSLANRSEITDSAKRITVTVVDAQQRSEQFVINTDAAYLRGALEQENLIAGEDSGTGLFVKSVHGINADNAKQEWWCFTQNGKSLMTGVDNTPIADGDAFTVTLTTGW